MKLDVMLDDGAKMPDRAHSTDGGADLFSREDYVIPAGGSHIFDTGVHMAIPYGYGGVLISKSGLNTRHGLISDGLIDCGFTGSICVKLYNLSDKDYHVAMGDKISQISIIPMEYCDFAEVDTLPDSDRGNAGYGSTGK